MKKLFVLAFTLVVACARGIDPSPPVLIIPIMPDGGDAEVDADCRVACETLAKLGCPESYVAGRTCGSVCTAAQAAGHDLRTFCIGAASTPDQVRNCCPDGVGCAPTRCEGR